MASSSSAVLSEVINEIAFEDGHKNRYSLSAFLLASICRFWEAPSNSENQALYDKVAADLVKKNNLFETLCDLQFNFFEKRFDLLITDRYRYIHEDHPLKNAIRSNNSEAVFNRLKQLIKVDSVRKKVPTLHAFTDEEVHNEMLPRIIKEQADLYYQIEYTDVVVDQFPAFLKDTPLRVHHAYSTQFFHKDYPTYDATPMRDDNPPAHSVELKSNLIACQGPHSTEELSRFLENVIFNKKKPVNHIIVMAETFFNYEKPETSFDIYNYFLYPKDTIVQCGGNFEIKVIKVNAKNFEKLLLPLTEAKFAPEESRFAEVTLAIRDVTYSTKPRKVTVKFFKTQDNSVPKLNAYDFERFHDAYQESLECPTAVHCSAGLGRTAFTIGSFIFANSENEAFVLNADFERELKRSGVFHSSDDFDIGLERKESKVLVKQEQVPLDIADTALNISGLAHKMRSLRPGFFLVKHQLEEAIKTGYKLQHHKKPTITRSISIEERLRRHHAHELERSVQITPVVSVQAPVSKSVCPESMPKTSGHGFPNVLWQRPQSPFSDVSPSFSPREEKPAFIL